MTAQSLSALLCLEVMLGDSEVRPLECVLVVLGLYECVLTDDDVRYLSDVISGGYVC